MTYKNEKFVTNKTKYVWYCALRLETWNCNTWYSGHGFHYTEVWCVLLHTGECEAGQQFLCSWFEFFNYFNLLLLYVTPVLKTSTYFLSDHDVTMKHMISFCLCGLTCWLFYAEFTIGTFLLVLDTGIVKLL